MSFPTSHKSGVAVCLLLASLMLCLAAFSAYHRDGLALFICLFYVGCFLYCAREYYLLHKMEGGS